MIKKEEKKWHLEAKATESTIVKRIENKCYKATKFQDAKAVLQ